MAATMSAVFSDIFFNYTEKYFFLNKKCRQRNINIVYNIQNKKWCLWITSREALKLYITIFTEQMTDFITM